MRFYRVDEYGLDLEHRGSSWHTSKAAAMRTARKSDNALRAEWHANGDNNEYSSLILSEVAAVSIDPTRAGILTALRSCHPEYIRQR